MNWRARCGDRLPYSFRARILFATSRSKLTRSRASGNIVATINCVHRFFGVLLPAVVAASLSFAQVAPIARPSQTPPATADDDEEEEVTPSAGQTPAVAQSGQTSPVAAPQPARPAPSVPRVIAAPAGQPARPLNPAAA